MEYRTYSVRVLCPFHGMLQVVALDGGAAESTDGYHWKLYVADERIVSPNGLSEVRYGSWTPVQGWSGGAVPVSAPSGLIERIGKQLIRALEECAYLVPFEPADHHEYWLLDKRQRPLALLDSATRQSNCGPAGSARWTPGAAARQDFASAHGDVEGLTRLLHEEAGARPQGIWIERSADGGGRTAHATEFAPEAFPELFIRSEWPQQADAALVKDFLAWQSPWLLQLHHINAQTRASLEQAAWQRPAETSKVFRLFPQVLDPHSLTTVRVKSRFLHEHAAADLAEPLYPFYNE